MATNTIEIRLVNPGGTPTQPSPTPPSPSGNGAPPATLPFPPGGRNPTPTMPANSPNAPPGTVPMPTPGSPTPVPPRFGPQSYPIPPSTPAGGAGPNTTSFDDYVARAQAKGDAARVKAFGDALKDQQRRQQEARDQQGRQDYLDRTRVDRAFEQEAKAKKEMEAGLIEYRKQKEKEAWAETQKTLGKIVAGIAVASQVLGTVNAWNNATNAARSQRIRGNVQEADLQQREADTAAVADTVGYVAGGIGFAVGGPLGAAIGYGIGRITQGIGDLFNASQKAFIERSKAFDELISRQAQISPEVATARARREINQFRLDMKEAEVLGPDLARLEEAKARLDTVNALKTLSNNILVLESQIKETNDKTDGEIEMMEKLIILAEAYGFATKEQIEQQKKLIDEMKKARDGQANDFGPTNDLLNAGRILGGTFAQGRVVDRNSGAMNTPLLSDFSN